MKRCLTCHLTYDDDYEYCENDGAHLIRATDLTPQGVRKKKVSSVNITVAGVAAGFFLGVGALIVFLSFNQRFPPQTSDRKGYQASRKVSAQRIQPSPGRSRESPLPSNDSWLESLFTVRATPTPEASPTPEMLPTLSVMPTPRNSPSPVRNSERPASTTKDDEKVGTESKITTIRFTDGTSLEVDDVWRDGNGIAWYRRGGMTARIDRKSVKSIERPPVPEQSSAPTQEPTSTKTPTPKPEGFLRYKKTGGL